MTLKPPTKTLPKVKLVEWPAKPRWTFYGMGPRLDKVYAFNNETGKVYLLSNNRGEATLTLRSAVDDYAGFLTGNREALWAQDARSIQPKWD